MIHLDIAKKLYIANDIRPTEIFNYKGELYLRIAGNGYDLGNKVAAIKLIDCSLTLLPIDTSVSEAFRNVYISYQP